jgi:hypothetical protein
VHHHHDTEEEFFFPKLEQQTGIPGLMGVNVEQHKAFHSGLDAWGKSTYVIGKEGEKEWNAEAWRNEIFAFAEPLVKHLHEEIATLVELADVDPDGTKLRKLWDDFDAKVVNEADKVCPPKKPPSSRQPSLRP